MTEEENVLTHVDDRGAAKMVDVGEKPIARRKAVASARIIMSENALEAIKNNTLKKGDALATARIAGIVASKRVPDLIPLCHNIPISSVEMSFEFEDSSIVVKASVTADARTGAEMEALTACSISALTIYDMAKSIDRTMVISDLRLLAKSGGRSIDYLYEEQ